MKPCPGLSCQKELSRMAAPESVFPEGASAELPPPLQETLWDQQALWGYSEKTVTYEAGPSQFSSVQLLSCVQLSATPWITARQASLSITISQSSLRHVHRVSEAIQPSHPLSSPSPPAPNPSQHQSLFQWLNSSHEVAKVLEFQL